MNPGSGKVADGTWEQAYENMKQFIKDCEIPLHIESANFEPDGGRYLFTLKADDFKFETEVEMPGLPLEKVRYMAEEGQNPFQYPRLYVDGSSWLWKFAIISKELVLEILKGRIEESNEEIKRLETIIDEIKYK